jgi:hypothetical protein
MTPESVMANAMENVRVGFDPDEMHCETLEETVALRAAMRRVIGRPEPAFEAPWWPVDVEHERRTAGLAYPLRLVPDGALALKPRWIAGADVVQTVRFPPREVCTPAGVAVQQGIAGADARGAASRRGADRAVVGSCDGWAAQSSS